MTTQTNPATTVEQGALFGDPATVSTDHGATVDRGDSGRGAGRLRAAAGPGPRLPDRGALRAGVPGRPGHQRRSRRGTALRSRHRRRSCSTAGYWSSAAPTPSPTGTAPARPARSSCRNAAARWPPAGPTYDHSPTATRQAQDSEEEPTTGPIVVDVVRPGRGLLTCAEFRGELIRDNGRYLVETEFGHNVGRASSYRAGAQLLARHHGYRPGPIEIDRREERDGNAPPKPTAR